MSGAALGGWVVCWRIERRDGVTIGLTAHDRDLTIGGLVHRAAPGMLPSAVVSAAGDDAETMEAAGALTATAIDERDLIAGRWDGARVETFMADWTTDPTATVPLATGSFGAIATGGGGFTTRLRGTAALLEAAAVEATSPDCRANLGDLRCGVAMRARRHRMRIAAAEDTMLTMDRAETVGNAFGGGRLRWLTGANSGLDGAIITSAGATLRLREPPAFTPVPGDLSEAIEGCDRTLPSCRDRFGNVANFRGEPFLPGIDLLTRYPGA